LRLVSSLCSSSLSLTDPSHSSDGVSRNVLGIPGSSVKKFHSEEEASSAYAEALADGGVVRVTLTITQETLHA
jgi:hypothetical protein